MAHSEVGSNGVNENRRPTRRDLLTEWSSPALRLARVWSSMTMSFILDQRPATLLIGAHGAHDAGVTHGCAKEIGGVGVEHGRRLKAFASEAFGRKPSTKTMIRQRQHQPKIGM